MIRMRLLVLTAAVLVVLLSAGGAATVTGQEAPIQPVPIAPPVCDVARFDLNGDGRLDMRDILQWRRLSAGCQLGSPVGELCPVELDYDHDGLVEYEDLRLMVSHWHGCFLRTDVGGRR